MEAFQVVISPDIVDVLRHEHRQIRQLCTDVQEAGPDRKKRSLIALQHAVHLHQLGELSVAHPAARNSSAEGDAVALTSQANGEQVERLLTEIGHLGATHPDFDARFEVLADALADHALHQERDEFPLLRRYVPTQRLHMMASEMHDVQTMARC
ncbi:hemerythrin domain-containing protein [Actinoplanes sp. NPDC049681]|uniref:hemerythrin domain-containing protein n=1 Tax=Actinoplanes sp. NPDC049681 TaxID=3363905 RepID=UPI0037AA6F97